MDPKTDTRMVGLLLATLWSAPLAATAQNSPANERLVLDSISVTDDQYMTTDSLTANKTATAALATPASLVTITREQMDHQNSQTVSEALRYSSGVLSDVEASARNNSVFLRGFGGFGTSTRVVDFLDGLKLPRGQAYAQFSIDPFLLERIEILKGPAAVLYGQVSPGGVINQFSRSPTRQSAHQWRAEPGSHQRRQSGIASRGSLDTQAPLFYAFTAIARDSETRFANVEDKRWALAPALTWAPDASTSLSLKGFYSRDPEGGIFNAALAKALAPTDYRPALNAKLNFGDPGAEDFNRKQYGIGYQFDRHWDQISIHSALRYAKVATDFLGVQFIGLIDQNGLLPRAAARSNETAKGIASDHRLVLDFSSTALGHQLMLGIDYQHSSADWDFSFGAISPLNVLAPLYNQPVGPFTPQINNRQIQTQTGFYLQDQLSFAQLRLTLGVRHDQAKVDTKNHMTGLTSSQSDNETSYRAGLLYLSDSGIAPYLSVATSFEPTIGVAANGTTFKPRTARQFEAGIKYQPLETALLLTASGFDIEQDNTLTPGAKPGFKVQQGQIRSRGLEFEARGELNQNLELIAAATWLDTEVRKSSNQAVIGKRPQAVPEQFASLWASYGIAEGMLAGLNLGGGLRYVASSFADDLNQVKSPAYRVVDFALRYQLVQLDAALQGMQLSLNVSNLLDKEYYTSCSFNIYCQYGNRRQLLAGLKYRW